ncbi:hypothetical protein H8E52_11630 [bacterium]|nr:hypothetical protein [bacterium]
MTSRRQFGSEKRQVLRLPGRLGTLRLERPGSAESLLNAMDDSHPEAEYLIPYWADCWPSAEGLLRYLLRIPCPRGSSLEIGAGLGISGMGALRRGWNLQISDFHPESLPWLKHNLTSNGHAAQRVLRLDWRETPPRRWKNILASDVLYERVFAPQIADFLDAALEEDGRALIAEPGRPIAEEGIALFATRFKLRLRPSRSRVEGRWWPIRVLEIRKS